MGRMDAFGQVVVISNARYAVPTAGRGIALIDSSAKRTRYLDGPATARAADAGGRSTPAIEPWGAAFDNVGQRLFVSYTDGSLHHWDIGNLAYLGAMVTAETAGPGADAASMLAVNGDGTLIAANRNDHQLLVYTVPDGQEYCRLQLASAGATAVAFAPWSNRLAALSGRGELYLWNLDQGRCELQARARGVPERSLSGRAGGKAIRLQWLDPDRLAAATSTGQVQVYQLDPAHWRQRVEAAFGHRPEVAYSPNSLASEGLQ
jgi:WD40 repeat protein